MTTTENMSSNKKITEKLDMKTRLSALWLFAMLTYTYGDVVTLMDPVKHGSIELTEGFLLGGSIFMMIPITMVLLSRILNYRASRWASIIAGTIMTLALIMTLFVAVPTTYYAFFTVIEVACTALIVWLAWKWRNPEMTNKRVVNGCDILPRSGRAISYGFEFVCAN